MASSIFGSAALTFKTVAVSGQSDIIADSSTDTLTVAAGSNITLTTNASTDTLTIAASGSSPTIGDTQVAYATSANTIGGNAALTFVPDVNQPVLTLGNNSPILTLGTVANGNTRIQGGALGVQIQLLAADGDATHVGGELVLSGGGNPSVLNSGGDVTLQSAATSGDSGALTLVTGLTSDGDSGPITIATGAAPQGTRGEMNLQAKDIISGADTSFQVYAGAANRSLELNNNALIVDAPYVSLLKLQLGDGGMVRTDTTTAHTALLQAYDVDGTAYKTFATLTNGNTPDFTIGPPSGGTVTVQATTFKSSDGTSGATAGPFTVITAITVKNGLVTALTGS